MYTRNIYFYKMVDFPAKKRQTVVVCLVEVRIMPLKMEWQGAYQNRAKEHLHAFRSTIHVSFTREDIIIAYWTNVPFSSLCGVSCIIR
jgi:hypothetical protein